GNALYARGRAVGAERSYRQALRSINEATNPHLAGIAYNGIAGVRYGTARIRGTPGDFKVAREMVLRSLRLKERVGDLHQIAVAYSNLVETDLAMKDVPAALDHGLRAVEIGERVGAGYDLAEMYRNLAEARFASGDVAGALDAGHKALSRTDGAGRIYLGG